MYQENKPQYRILLLIALAHGLNDLIQGVIPSIYPALQSKYALTMAQVGVITLCYQLSASILQPLVGNYTDKHPKPYSQVLGMAFTTMGIVSLSLASSYTAILCSVVFIGVGSSVFHPESSRVAFLASGGRRSFAQAIFQLGGNFGTALAPLLVILVLFSKKVIDGRVIEESHQGNLIWFAGFSIFAMVILLLIGKWRSILLKLLKKKAKKPVVLPNLTRAQIRISKNFYTAAINNYFQFYTIKKFGFSNAEAQVYLFYFLGAVAAGSLIGGFLGDKVGRKFIIWFSILGAAPFALWLPYADATTTAVLIVLIGFIISSAFASILVYSQELLPQKIGMISGFFYGFAFGMGGLASAVLGKLIDITNIDFVYKLCSFLPLMGLIAYFLPNLSSVSLFQCFSYIYNLR